MCSKFNGDPSKGICFALRAKWTDGMCWRHATQSGCLAPKKKARVCKVCEQISNNEKEIAKNKGRGCDLIPTPTRDAAKESWTDGLCYRHARLAGLCPNNKIFDDAKKNDVSLKSRGQTQLPWLCSTRTAAQTE